MAKQFPEVNSLHIVFFFMFQYMFRNAQILTMTVGL